MKINVIQIPHFELTLSEAVIIDIISFAHIHYDGECKASVRRGGFLYGFKNMIDEETKTATRIFTNRELQTISKILEQAHYTPDYCSGCWNDLLNLELMICAALKE